MENTTSRRNVLAGLCAIAALGTTTLLPLSPAEAASAIKVRKDGKVGVRLSALKRVGAVVRIPTLNAALVREGARKYVAYNLACTHMGVPVDTSGPVWVCPAHGSEYNPKNGDVVRGPAKAPLRKIRVHVAKGIAVVG